MDKLCFLLNKDKYFYALITRESKNIIRLVFDQKPTDDVLVGGFEILNENNNFSMSGDYYYGYNTIYNVIDDNTVLLSNDGSVYIHSTESNESVNEIELTDEEIAAIEKQNQIYELKNKIQTLKNELLESDYIIIKCQEYLLAGKDLPDEYDIATFSEERDIIRTKINVLEEKLNNI